MTKRTSHGIMRTIARAAIIAGLFALVFWTVLATAGHHVSLAHWIAPVIAVVAGLVSLRSARRP